MTRRSGPVILVLLIVSSLAAPALAVPALVQLSLDGPHIILAQASGPYAGRLNALLWGLPRIPITVLRDGAVVGNVHTDNAGYYAAGVRFARGTHEVRTVALSSPVPEVPTLFEVDSPALVVIAADPPTAPRNVAASIDAGGHVALTWSAPADDGGLPVNAYSVRRTSDDGGAPVTTNLGAAARSMTDSGVAFVAYTYTVTAANAVASGPASSAVTVTLLPPHTVGFTIPSDPTHVPVTFANGRSTLTARGSYHYGQDARHADAAYSYGENGGPSCVHLDGNLHEMVADGVSPWHGTPVTDGNAVLTSDTNGCDATYAYHASVDCTGSCTLEFYANDDVFWDNSGSLQLYVTSPTG